ncbi:MAG: hypothetical protein EBU84_11980, partial [Actinobacteria bacterium]|nr:hypothetical protein [Actinomycetota bacterium]
RGGDGVIILRFARSNTYTYDLNGGTGATPTGGTALTGSNITTAAGTGLTRTGYTFAGWNTAANGSGTALAANSTVAMPASASALVFYAQWTANTLNITYDANGGNSPVGGSATTITGGTISSLATTSRSGFTFSGWFTAPTSGTQVTTSAAHNQTSSFSLFARWTSCGSSVVQSGLLLHLDAGNSCSTTGSTTSWVDISTNGNNATLVSNPAYTASTSGGFYSFASNNQHGTVPAGFADFTTGFTISFFARFLTTTGAWQRIIDFGNGGESNNILVGRYWNTDQLVLQFFKGTVTSPVGYCTSDAGAIVNNVWTHFAITVDPTNGCIIYKNGIVIKTVSSYTTMPNNISRTTNFIARSHWSADTYFTGAIGDLALYNTALTASQVATNFAAQVDASYTVTYNLNGQAGSVPTDSLRYLNGATVTISSTTPTASGSTFVGWTTDAAGNGTVYSPSGTYTMTAANVIFYAKWATVPGAPTIGTPTAGSGQITVNWSAPASNGGSAITNYIVDYSSDAGSTWTTFTAAASTATSRTVTGLTNGIAYRFRVSAVNIVGTGTASGTSITLTPTGVTTACSTAAGTGDPYRVDAGGSPTNETCNKAFDNSTSTKYVNWGGVNQNNGSNGVGGNGGVNTSVLIDLKGPWAITAIGLTTANDYENRDPISFQLYGSNTSFTSGMTLLGTVTGMSPPTTRNADYTSNAAISSQGAFRYYQLKFTGIRSETPDPLVAVSEIRLYGVQNPTIITSTFDANGGTGSSSATTISNGSLLVAPTTPTRAGYNFLGWTVLSTGGSAISFPYSHGQSANFTLYARWNAAQQTISYIANGGSGTPIPTLGNTDTTVTLRPGSEFTRSGYTLLRWDTLSTGSGTSYTLGQTGLTMPAGGFTLYAIWSANSQTITYMPGTGGSGTVAATTGSTDSTVTLSNGQQTSVSSIAIGISNANGFVGIPSTVGGVPRGYFFDSDGDGRIEGRSVYKNGVLVRGESGPEGGGINEKAFGLAIEQLDLGLVIAREMVVGASGLDFG